MRFFAKVAPLFLLMSFSLAPSASVAVPDGVKRALVLYSYNDSVPREMLSDESLRSEIDTNATGPILPNPGSQDLVRYRVEAYEDGLPAGSIVRFKQPAFYELYRWHILVVILLLLVETGFIVYLLRNRALLKRAEASLHQTQFCIDSAAEGIFMVAADGRFLFGNESLCRMVGSSRSELLSLRVPDVDPQLTTEVWPGFWEECKGRGMAILESAARSSDGREFPIELTVNYFSQQGREFLFGSVRDISERQEVEKDLRAAHAELERRVEERTAELASANQTLRTEIEVRHRAEATLQQSEARLQAMFKNVAAGIVTTDAEGYVIEINDKMLEMLGYGRDEVLGKKPYNFTHPDDLPQSINTHERALKGELDSFQLEKRYQRKDGSVFWGDLNVTKIFDVQGSFLADFAIVFDITERKLAEEALRESEARFRSLFEAAASGLVTISPEGRFLKVNQAFCDFLGYTQIELLDLSVNDITHPDDRTRTSERYNNLQSGRYQSIDYDKRFLRKDGTTIWGHASVASVPGADLKPMYYVGLVLDITERKQAEAAMAQAKALAEAASHAKSEFLANMSHEIRTPLNVVTGYSELLSSMVSDPTQQSYLEAIKTAGKSLLTLVSDILDLSKIEAGMLEIVHTPVSLKLLFGEMSQIFKVKLGSRNLQFGLTIDPKLPSLLMLDETRIRQILLNLVGNAVKFTQEGEVRLTAKKLAAPENRNRVDLLIAVEDTGVGIPAEEQEQVFESFKQLSGQVNKKYGGTGLGLAICKRLVEIMDGRISVASRPGGGCIFEVVLRGVEIATHEESAIIEVAPPIENIVFDKAKILVVDDIETNRDLLCELLGRVNLNVLTAENGQEALNLVERYQPELIVMDIRMPVLDGIEATRQLKANPKTRQIPVIALTASTVENQTSLMEKGFDGYLLKPAGAGRLFSELAKHLAHRVAEEPGREDIANESLEVEKIAKLDEMIATFRDEILPCYEEVKGAMELSMVQRLAEGLVDLGRKHAARGLVAYGTELIDYVKQVDVENTRRKIQEFPKLAEQLNNAVRKNHE